MLFDDQVGHIAKLARIGLSDVEKDRFAKNLAAILDFIDKLKEVDVEGVEPTAQAAELVNVMRVDESIKRGQESRNKILANAPAAKDGYIKVKAVFE